MTGTELFTLFQELLGGRSMNETAFYQLLNMKKNLREQRRPWVKLRSEDSTNTVTASTRYTTQLTLPSRFIRTYGQYPLKLVSGPSVLDYAEIPFGERHRYQDTSGYFAIDHKNSKFYVMGQVGQSYTAYLNFIQGTEDIDNDSEWQYFPEFAHPLLAFDVAATQKGGISYDDINARMVQSHGRDIADLEGSLIQWDAQLATRAAGV